MRSDVQLIRKKLSRSYAQVLDSCGYSKTATLLDRFSVKLSSYSRHALIDCERTASDVFVGWLRDGGNVLDVGANYGRYAMLAARMAKPHHKVIAVEADPFQYRVLRRNLELNDWLDSVVAVNKAAWDARASVSFHVSDGGRSSIASRWGNNLGRVDVEAVTMDELVTGLAPRIDVVKIDIEGAEYRCLLGMQTILRRDRPKLLLELHPAALSDIGGSVQEIEALLCDHSYEVFDTELRPVQDLSSHAQEHKMVVALAAGQVAVSEERAIAAARTGDGS